MRTLELKCLVCSQTSETKDVAKGKVIFRMKFAGSFAAGSINSPIPVGRLDLTLPDHGLVAAKVDDTEGTVTFGVTVHVPLSSVEEIRAAREHAAWLMDGQPQDVTAEYQGVLVQKSLDLDDVE